MKVLVVDDSATMRTIIKRSLAAQGIADTAEAGDGLAALSLFQAGGIDAVLCDWNMPNMDGLQFLTEVRKLNKQVPFIMVTTETERSRVVSAIQAGVSDYVVKPFTTEQLQAKLQKWMIATA